MKISIKTLACAAATSMLLLSCDLGTNSEPSVGSNKEPSTPPSTSPCSEYAKKTTIYYSYDVYNGPVDPTIVVIVGDVKDWIDQQLASGGTKRKLIYVAISDLPLIRDPLPELPSALGYIDSTGKERLFLEDGQEVTWDDLKEMEYAWSQERPKLIEERISSYINSLNILGEDVEILHAGWKASMTAAEVVELAENNEGLAISFWKEAPYMPEIDGEYVDAGGNAGYSRCP